MDWKKARELITSNEVVSQELKENDSKYQLIRELIKIRKEKKMTQTKLAEIIHTRQSNISRLESGDYNPSLELLTKIARATHKKLEIRFT